MRAPPQISVGRGQLQKIYCNFASRCCDNVRAMTYTLPPMNPLRAFEAAARAISASSSPHMSCT
jgi:hypothetical protein